MSEFINYAVCAFDGEKIWLDDGGGWTRHKDQRKIFRTIGTAFEATAKMIQGSAMTERPDPMCAFRLVRIISQTKIETHVREGIVS